MDYASNGLRSLERGGLTEAVILTSLAKAGYTVLLPFGVTRYDLAIDDRRGSGIKTVQCKTGRIRKGCITFATCSRHTLTHVRTGYRGQVDYFAVWCPEREDDTYLVPVNDVGQVEAWLRIEPSKNGQSSGVRWAKDYLVAKLHTDGV